jgi:deoxycytidylate deaminase
MNNHKIVGFGGNFINTEISSCPREMAGLISGQGYFYCKKACDQNNHAEVEACLSAGDSAVDGTLYLIGHTYACDDCIKVIKEHGIKKIIICDTQKIIEL